MTIDAQGPRCCGSPRCSPSGRDGHRALGLPPLAADCDSKPFNEVSAALTGPVQRERAWDAVVKEANSICARYPHEELVIRPALPRNRADYVGAMEIALERERAIQAELAKLQPPPITSFFTPNSSTTDKSPSRN